MNKVFPGSKQQVPAPWCEQAAAADTPAVLASDASASPAITGAGAATGHSGSDPAASAADARSQSAMGPDMVITQASGLIAKSATDHFNGVSKQALASQAVLLKQMPCSPVGENPPQAEDALEMLVTDVLVGAAAMAGPGSTSEAIDEAGASSGNVLDALGKRTAGNT